MPPASVNAPSARRQAWPDARHGMMR